MEVSSFDAGTKILAREAGNPDSDDFETFLRMLTAQIQNQDPLSPMEADQFASQLASFSMVEQQTLTNQNLDRMIRALSNGGLAAYSGLVGRVAAHEGAFVYSGAPVEMEIGIPGGIDEYAKLAILDGGGVMVAELNVDVGQEKLTWEGRGLDGRMLPPGSFIAEMRQAEDGAPLEIPVFTAAVVEEVRFGDGEAELLLADGTVLPESRVSKIR